MTLPFWLPLEEMSLLEVCKPSPPQEISILPDVIVTESLPLIPWLTAVMLRVCF